MRHSRRAVMAERYKLYMKKNIFNGRYFVRNLQIGICVVLVIALIAGTVVLTHSGEQERVVTADAGVSVKEALFGNSEEEKKVTKNNTEEEIAAESTTEVKTEEITEEVIEAESTQQVSSETDVAETVEEMDTAEETDSTEEEKSAFDGKCIANVDETLNVRKEPSTDAEFAGSMNRGAIAKVESVEGEWTKVKSGDVEGYVLTQYILTGQEAEEFAQDYVTLRGTILEDGVNIRAEKSTDAEIVVVLDKDDILTVLEKSEENSGEEAAAEADDENTEKSAGAAEQTQTESNTDTSTTETVSTENDTTKASVNTEASTETPSSEAVTEEVSTESGAMENNTEQETSQAVKANDITWLSVMLEDGQTGYVSADLVNVEELYEIAVSAEELERRAAEEAAAKKAAEEEAARQAAAKQAAAQTSNSNSNSGGNSNSGSEDSYKGATTTPVTTSESGECIGTFTITAYCGCKKCSGGSKKTASGTTPTEGRTIAADTSVLPFGTKVVIGGVVYTVEDCGSGVTGNHIDIFFATHSKALAFGRKSMKVYKY